MQDTVILKFKFRHAGVAGLGPDCSIRPLHLPHLCGCQPLAPSCGNAQNVGQGNSCMLGTVRKYFQSRANDH